MHMPSNSNANKKAVAFSFQEIVKDLEETPDQK